eukprot:Clim_evm133s210 gene=Clim_evmTU133s210
MVVNGLYTYLQSHGLIKSEKLTVLKNANVAIDAFQFLRDHLGREPYQTPTGGIPLQLEDKLRKGYKQLVDANITPIFVFSGMQVAKKDSQIQQVMRSGALKGEKRVNAWDMYRQGRRDPARDNWMQTTVITIDIVNFAMKVLISCGAECMRACYSAWPQLCWLESVGPTRFAHAIYGNLECLLFGADRLITHWDLSQGTFEWVDIASALPTMGFDSREQFIEACMLAGFEWVPTFPPIAEHDFSFQRAIDTIRNYHVGYEAVRAYVMSTGHVDYSDAFQRAAALIKHHPVTIPGKSCSVMNSEEAPSDMANVLGNRVPDSLYFLAGFGILSTVLLNNICHRWILDHAPLCGGSSLAYRSLLETLTPMRQTALSLLVAVCNDESLKTNDMRIIRWFAPENPMMFKADQNLKGEFQGFYVPKAQIFEQQNQSIAQMADYLQKTSTFFKAQQGLKAGEANGNAETGHQVGINSTWKDGERGSTSAAEVLIHALGRMMHHLGYLNDDGTLTPWGELLQKMDDERLDMSLVCVELVKAGLMTADHYITVKNRQLPELKDGEREAMLLGRLSILSRVSANSKAWQERAEKPELSLDLLQFHSLYSGMQTMMRHMLECTVTHLLLSDRVFLKPSEYRNLYTFMPFDIEFVTVPGIVVQAVLSGQVDGDLKGANAAYPELQGASDVAKVGLRFARKFTAAISTSTDIDNNALKELNTDDVAKASAALAEKFLA